MTHEDLMAESKNVTWWRQHKFLLLVGLTIVISITMVVIALGMYTNSGTAQLDLSRPGYSSVRDQVSRDDGNFRGFSANGPIDKETLDQFRELYDARAKEATGVDSFGGNVLTDKSLSIDAPE